MIIFKDITEIDIDESYEFIIVLEDQYGNIDKNKVTL